MAKFKVTYWMDGYADPADSRAAAIDYATEALNDHNATVTVLPEDDEDGTVVMIVELPEDDGEYDGADLIYDAIDFSATGTHIERL